MRLCSVKGCKRKYSARGLCAKHYFQRPEVKAKQRAYYQRPEAKAKARAYYQRPEVKARHRAYQQRPEVKEVKNQLSSLKYRVALLTAIPESERSAVQCERLAGFKACLAKGVKPVSKGFFVVLNQEGTCATRKLEAV